MHSRDTIKALAEINTGATWMTKKQKIGLVSQIMHLSALTKNNVGCLKATRSVKTQAMDVKIID